MFGLLLQAKVRRQRDEDKLGSLEARESMDVVVYKLDMPLDLLYHLIPSVFEYAADVHHVLMTQPVRRCHCVADGRRQNDDFL